MFEERGLFYSAHFVNTLYRASEGEILEAAKDMGFDPAVDYWEITNAYDNYLYHWERLKHMMIINLVLSALILALEVMLIITVIRLQYSVNTIELSIKKVLGYSLWERSGGLLLLTGVVGIAGALTAVLLIYLHYASTTTVLLGSLLIITVEITVVLVYARKFECMNITKILKGGAL